MLAAGAAHAGQQGDAAAEMGHAGAVRRLLRRQGQGLLQGRRARRDDQAGRPGHRARAGDRRRRRRRRSSTGCRPRSPRARRACRWSTSPSRSSIRGSSSPAAPTPASRSPRTSRAARSASGSTATNIRSSTGWASSKFPTDGSAAGVKVLKQGFNVDPLIQKQADCISTMTYNEYWQVIDAGYKPEQLVVFKYEDQGVATLEDGLYAMEDKLKDPAFVDKMAKFVKASMKGWEYARAHPDEAVKIVLDNDATGAQTEHHQKQMMSEINKLTDRLRRQARQGRLRAHGEDAADRRLRPGHLQGADRRLHDRRHRQGAGQVTALIPPRPQGGRSGIHCARLRSGSPVGPSVPVGDDKIQPVVIAVPYWAAPSSRFRFGR